MVVSNLQSENQFTLGVKVQTIVNCFQNIPWLVLLLAAGLLGLAPFRPEPHLVEKLRMLTAGQLVRPIDVFDLLLHGMPFLLILGKLLFGRHEKKPGDNDGVL